jgi:hypothetical protein
MVIGQEKSNAAEKSVVVTVHKFREENGRTACAIEGKNIDDLSGEA